MDVPLTTSPYAAAMLSLGSYASVQGATGAPRVALAMSTKSCVLFWVSPIELAVTMTRYAPAGGLAISTSSVLSIVFTPLVAATSGLVLSSTYGGTVVTLGATTFTSRSLLNVLSANWASVTVAVRRTSGSAQPTTTRSRDCPLGTVNGYSSVCLAESVPLRIRLPWDASAMMRSADACASTRPKPYV